MSSRYLDALAASRSHIRTLYMIIVFLMLVCVGLWIGWREAPRDLRISIPPDLRTGAIVEPGEYQAATVYAFALTYLQALNRWETDGAKDFPARIEQYQAYVTPKYLDELKATMNAKMGRGELKQRRRYTLPIEGYQEYQADHVTTLSDGSWEVDIGLQVVENVAELEAKNVDIMYPLHVVRYKIDPARNIWGLALDGMAQGKDEQRIDDPS